MEKTDISLHEMYKSILEGYLLTNSEHCLYEAQQFSRELIKENMSPEEMVNLHVTVVQELIPSLPPEVLATNELLLEVMVGYGLAYREHQSLRDRQKQLDSEFAVAAKMQQQLLPKDVPRVEPLDIGIKSVAASAVSGDYYHFNEDDQWHLGFAVADIIGKGVPAALCMSMIKYAMDSLPEQRLQPSALLENLNRVVEQNISSTMFITMIYGSYDLQNHIFHYSGAGHEPGFYYQATSDQFFDLETKGLVLGLTKKAKFQEYQAKVEIGDIIVLLSDGVTECRTESGFIERSEVMKLIRSYLHLSAQEIAENVYSDIEKLQNFQLKDDFTLMIIRRDV
ncbi:PP2C family protein-serine/threonine phosphatase [Anaerobacillus sp. CMMVII]|uniref:PP2C family protein-serine/threonine phosphatase n=1 Tax=Anaerobacillus sp. CMMVII TaxID=2755588 RepID=UPI0021B6EA3B|nr:PP2C family protein-serine/threonine phosphatase [Anaerobacillus sp. CMMVII]MCT8136573.1 PP2C family protein-serine/threonine phosphatase [Anaerobacillus sp. CMMVII]